MQKVFVVMGTTGEYSDRNEWPVIAYFDKKKAKERVTLATRRAKEIEVAGKGRTYSDAKDLHTQNEFDPEMEMDYTGTNYFIYEVALAPK